MRRVIFLGLVLCSMSRVSADETVSKSENFHFHLGVDGFWSHFKNYYHASKETHNSYLLGPSLEFEYRKPEAFYFDFEAMVAFGNNHGKATFYKRGKENFTHRVTWFDGNLGFGYTFQAKAYPSFLISLYGGFGRFQRKYDAWLNSWFYWQMGLKASHDWSNMLNLGVDFKAIRSILYDPFWGIELGFPITCYLGEERRWDIRVKPYLLKLRLDRSETILGARLEAGYSF